MKSHMNKDKHTNVFPLKALLKTLVIPAKITKNNQTKGKENPEITETEGKANLETT